MWTWWCIRAGKLWWIFWRSDRKSNLSICYNNFKVVSWWRTETWWWVFLKTSLSLDIGGTSVKLNWVVFRIDHLSLVAIGPTTRCWLQAILLLSSGKILIIGGGIANFTNVSATFKVWLLFIARFWGEVRKHLLGVTSWVLYICLRSRSCHLNDPLLRLINVNDNELFHLFDH